MKASELAVLFFFLPAVGYSQAIQNNSADQQAHPNSGEYQTTIPGPDHIRIRPLSFGSPPGSPYNALPFRSEADGAFQVWDSEKESEARRSVQNLEAQQRSAFWTMVTGMAAIASVFIGLLGLWLVRGTLLATRGALTEAQAATAEARLATAAAEKSVLVTEDTARRQLRSYLSPLSITYKSASGTSDGSEGFRIVIDAAIKNTGATPAFMCELVAVHSTIEGSEISRSKQQIWELGSGGEWKLIIASNYPPFNRQGQSGQLFLKISHTDIFDARHERDYLYLVVFKQGGGIAVEPYPFQH